MRVNRFQRTSGFRYKFSLSILNTNKLKQKLIMTGTWFYLVLPNFRRIYSRRMGSYPQEVERKRVMVWGKCWCMITRDSSAESTTFIGGTTLDCIIWLLLETHWSVTFGLGLNHTRLQHFYMIQHVKCCTLMCVNQLPNDSV